MRSRSASGIPRPLIDHPQHETLRLFHEHDLDHSARIAELDGIVQKIQERMHQQILVAAVETRVIRRLLCHQNALFAGRALDALQGFGHHVLQRKGQPPDLLPAAFQTRDIQKVPNHPVQPPGLAADLLGKGAVRSFQFFHEHLAITQNDRKRLLELVRHDGYAVDRKSVV